MRSLRGTKVGTREWRLLPDWARPLFEMTMAEIREGNLPDHVFSIPCRGKTLYGWGLTHEDNTTYWLAFEVGTADDGREFVMVLRAFAGAKGALTRAARQSAGC